MTRFMEGGRGRERNRREIKKVEEWKKNKGKNIVSSQEKTRLKLYKSQLVCTSHQPSTVAVVLPVDFSSKGKKTEKTFFFLCALSCHLPNDYGLFVLTRDVF